MQSYLSNTIKTEHHFFVGKKKKRKKTEHHFCDSKTSLNFLRRETEAYPPHPLPHLQPDPQPQFPPQHDIFFHGKEMKQN
jgi:hypothetical protein